MNMLPEQAVPPLLQPACPPTQLTADELRFRAALPDTFQTTADLPSVGRDFVGQDRARAALELGLGISSTGFNIVVSGLTGAHKLQALHEWVRQQVAQAPTPGDWVYVHNFANPDMPRAIALSAGQGSRLKSCMHQLVKDLREELPKAFREEAFDKEKDELKNKYMTQVQELRETFEAKAKAKGFLFQLSGQGFMLVPLVDGKPLPGPEAFEQLSEEQQKTIEHNRCELLGEITDFPDKQHDLMRAMAEDIRHVEQRFCRALLAPRLAEISRELTNPTVDAYLDEVQRHIIDNLDNFKEAASPSREEMPFPFAMLEREPFLEYEVNVVVDNAATTGAPVIVESAPTYQNLFGTIERVVDRGGRLVTNFTRIKAGSLLRAQSGYLICNLEDALTELAVWKILKRTLKSGRIEMETYEPFALFATSGLRPEPIDIQVKVIVVGSPYLYHLLYALDDEFHEIFKTHADFRQTMERNGQHDLVYGQWVAEVCNQEGLPHFDRSGVERLIEFGVRQAADREKVLAAHAEVADLVREAAYWARKEASPLVSAQHVKQAIQQRIFRSNRIEEDLREMITQGTILLDSSGSKVGQVNGLAVLSLGGHSFGRPSRVTASVAMGQAGLVNIERESRLSGAIHDKGLLILSGYLRNRYGHDKPLALSASVCFEQSYAGIDGDSASSTELYALLSRLAEVPLRQDLAVTGSVNQWGEVQAIGGANEKVEGFFDVCKAHGLTGQQGVLIPAANVRHLILREDVLAAIEQRQFHIYPIRTIDQGIELLSGVRAGTVDEPGTINGAVNKRLHDLAVGLKNFAGDSTNEATASENEETP